MASFTTLAPGSRTEAQLVEKRSRFLAIAVHAESDDEARAFFADVAGTYHDARHVCRAYALRDGRSWSSDDGEPSGTAGRPMLARIEAAGLVDTAVAVVRWFGGVKLGPSGLIAAYRGVTQEVLDNAPRQEVVEMTEIIVEATWAAAERLKRMAERMGAKPVDHAPLGDRCRVTLSVELAQAEALSASLAEMLMPLDTKGRVIYESD